MMSSVKRWSLMVLWSLVLVCAGAWGDDGGGGRETTPESSPDAAGQDASNGESFKITSAGEDT